MAINDKATAKNYTTHSNRIFTGAADGGRKTFTASPNLTEVLNELSNRFGQIWTGTKPSDPELGDLFYSASGGLEVCSAVTPTPVWKAVVPSSMTVNIYTGNKGAYEWDRAAQEIAAANYNDASVNPKPETGDLIVVTDTTASPAITETFIITSVATISGTAVYSDFGVEWVTTKKAEEIEYSNTVSNLDADNVQDAIDELASKASGMHSEFFEKTLTDPTAGATLDFVGGNKMPSIGVKLVTCTVTISGNDGTHTYVSCGKRNFVVNGTSFFNGVTLSPDSETLTDYFSTWDDTNGTCPLDVTDLTFTFSGSPAEFGVAVIAAVGTYTVSVRVDY